MSQEKDRNEFEDRLEELFSEEGEVRNPLVTGQTELNDWMKQIQSTGREVKPITERENEYIVPHRIPDEDQISVKCSYCKHVYTIPATMDTFICIHCMSKFSIEHTEHGVKTHTFTENKNHQENLENRPVVSWLKSLTNKSKK